MHNTPTATLTIEDVEADIKRLQRQRGAGCQSAVYLDCTATVGNPPSMVRLYLRLCVKTHLVRL
jgi:hypothetical protein